MYAEVRPSGEKSSIVGYRTPGLNLFASFGDTPVRGALPFEADSVFFVVHRGTLWEVNNAGTMTNRGTLLTTSGNVSMSDNGTQVMIVDGTYGYTYNTATNAFAQITDGDFPSNPVTVCFLGGRFVVNVANSSRFYVSNDYDGTTWDALDYANAESSPDPIAAVWSSNGQLVLFGTRTTEYWGLSGSGDFPFASIQGTATEWGLAAAFSVAKFDNSVACLIQNRMGQVMVAKLNGYLPQAISNPDIDAEINSYSSVSDAVAYSFMLGGHPFYVINFPAAARTWMYDGQSGIWSKWTSDGLQRHRGEFGINYLTNTMVFDYENGNIYTLDTENYSDNGAQIESEVVCETVATGDEDVVTIDKLRLDVAVGVGTTSGQGSDPRISLSVSRDNGQTWGAEMFRSLGKKGEYKRVVSWNRLGSARNFVFKIRVTDPVPFTLVSASINPVN